MGRLRIPAGALSNWAWTAAGTRAAARAQSAPLAAASALAHRRTIAPAGSTEWIPETLFPACHSWDRSTRAPRFKLHAVFTATMVNTKRLMRLAAHSPEQGDRVRQALAV